MLNIIYYIIYNLFALYDTANLHSAYPKNKNITKKNARLTHDQKVLTILVFHSLRHVVQHSSVVQMLQAEICIKLIQIIFLLINY